MTESVERARLGRAEQLNAAGHHAEAERLVRDVLAADPESVPALILLARALNGQDRSQEATGPASEACRLEPTNVSALIVLSYAATQAKQPRYAVETATHAVALAPHDPATHYTLAQALLTRSGGGTSALREADEAARLAPGWSDVHNLRGLCLVDVGRIDDARTAFEHALSLEPGHALALSNLAGLDIKRNPLSAARRLTQAAALEPQREVIQANLRIASHNFALQVQWLIIGGGLLVAVIAESHAPSAARISVAAVLGLLVAVAAAHFVMQLPRGSRRSPLGLVRSFGVSAWARVVVFVFVIVLVAVVTFGDDAQVDWGTGRLVWLVVVSVIVVFVRRSRARGR